MSFLKLELSEEAWRRLVASAVVEHRPIRWQAEILLLRALGLPAPLPDAAESEEVVAVAVPSP